MSFVPGTAGDPSMVDAIARAEANNRRFAQLWREMMRPDAENSPAESLRRTARGAVEDWLEVRDAG